MPPQKARRGRRPRPRQTLSDKYYRAENARWHELTKPTLTRGQARRLLQRLMRRFCCDRGLRLFFSTGRPYSEADGKKMILETNNHNLTPLLVVHEFCHSWREWLTGTTGAGGGHDALHRG